MCSLLEERSSWDSVRGREDPEEEEERRDDVDKYSGTARRLPGKLNEREIQEDYTTKINLLKRKLREKGGQREAPENKKVTEKVWLKMTDSIFK